MKTNLWFGILCLFFATPAMGDLGDELLRFIPDMPVSNQDFGDAVDLFGNRVLVGAEDTPSGAIPSAGMAFVFDATTGDQLFSIVPDEAPASRAFGGAVSISQDRIVVAAEDENNVTGAAYLFDGTGQQIEKLVASDAAQNHEFGQAVGIGNGVVAVSAPGANLFRGQFYLFDSDTGLQIGNPIAPDPNDLTPGTEFGNSMGIDGDRIVVGIENGGVGGAAYIFDTAGNQLHKLLPPVDPVTTQPVRGFGRSVAISGNVALIGATPDADEVTPSEFGRAYLYDVTTGDMLFELIPDDSMPEDLFSEDLDIDGNVALVAARREPTLGLINQAYLFDVRNGKQLGLLNPDGDIMPGDEVLEGIAIDGGFAVGGVEGFDSPGFANNGIAILFDAQLPLLCDFDGNQLCDIADIDALVAEISAGNNVTSFDINGDGSVNNLDLEDWLDIAGNENIGAAYLFGDSNLDGAVDGSDFIAWNNNKFNSIAAWSAGDFNADGFVDGQDFIIWNNNKFTSSAGISVPEPVTALGMLVALSVIMIRRQV